MDDVFESIVRNAIDYLKTSLKELELSPSRSVASFATAVELVCKARLVKEHWTLIVRKPDECSEAKFKAGECLTIDAKSISKRLQAVVGYRFTETEERVFTRMRNHRNKLIHFYDETFSKPPDDATRVEVVSELCAGWYYLYRLVTKKWNDVFKDFVKEFDELEQLMAKERGFLKAKYGELKPGIDGEKASGVIFLCCPICSFDSERRSDILPPLYYAGCGVCGSFRNYLIIPCPSCSKDVIIEDIFSDNCTNCNVPVSVEQTLEFLSPMLSPKERAACGLEHAYCEECDSSEPCVVQIGEDWLCVSCFTIFNEVDRCDNCGELATGDLSDSHFSGCTACAWLISHDDYTRI